MGQAKQRGTFDQRKDMAESRNKLIEADLRKNPQSGMEKYRRQHGTQRLATRLVAAGLMMNPKPQ
jgi:hypothetical protein